MKLSFVLRDKKNALKLSAKTLESFIERIKTDTKDGAVSRRRRQLAMGDYIDSYERQYPSHLVYPSAEFEKDGNDNLRMKNFNGVVALTVDHLESQADIDAVKRAAQILHYTLAAFIGPSGREVVILVSVERTEGRVLTEEDADAVCQEGHRLASALYQALMPKPVRQEVASVRSCFRMPLDEHPFLNTKAVALPVSEKPSEIQKSQSQNMVPVFVEPQDEG